MDKSRRLVIASVCVAGLLGAAAPARAAVFNVADATAFQAALTTAAGNGEDDVVTVAAGTYALVAPLVYTSGEGRSLTISGAGIGSTILDGGGVLRPLSLDAQEVGAALTVRWLTVRNGRASGSGGGCLALATGSASQTVDAVEVSGCEVTGNADVGGGAALVTGGGDVTVTNSRFSLNQSAGNVGGLYMATSSGHLELRTSTFTLNSVDNSGGSEYFGDGGGAMLYGDAGSSSLVEGCTFEENQAGGGSNPDAGGLMIYQLNTGVAATVRGCLFRDNLAGLGGGGLFVRFNATGSIAVEDNHFAGNTATAGTGGGCHLHLDTGTLTVTGNVIAANTCGDEGGGLYVSLGGGSATLSGNRYLRNSAASNGGGLLLYADAASVEVDGDIAWGNDAGNVGGGLSYATNTGHLTLAGSTFAGNQGGGGLYLYLDQPTATTTLRDLILWGNLPSQVDGASAAGPASFTVTYSDVEGGTGEPWFGTGSVDADPIFTAGAGGNVHLASASSPAVDAGDPLSPLDPDGSRADQGALPFDASYLFDDTFATGLATAWAVVVP